MTVVAAAVSATLISAGPAAAATPPGCSSVSQIGATGYIKGTGGVTAASVKQYYGCGKNYSYVWVWESFRDNAWSSVYTAVVTRDGDRHGGVGKARPAYEVWSNGANTSGVCTYAVGQLMINDRPFAAASSEVC
ncbi:uncharacterized protein SAZU_5142 [Streptomyces azureus]|uniref:Secreted protein n=1 Tax=Streptomyces azureus TaxID=146537 RepID=A0A0K8PR03_STRAJ|nr:uncharacterized protein SAZU_5142 [Streptomyces azureus]